MSNLFNIAEAISPYQNYCAGYGTPGASGGSYITGLTIATGKSKAIFRHDGITVLDDINAFDLAEIEETYIGQINMVTVSSFCGPMGAILGYDLLKDENNFYSHEFLKDGHIVDSKKRSVPVYSAKSLRDATLKLFGSVDGRKFPLMPGSTVPCASKNITAFGERHIYCGFGLGIAENRSTDANLFMEDVGEIPINISKEDIDRYKNKIIENISKSVLCIGENQRIKFKEIFVDIKDLYIGKDEVGCALVAAPYFTLARDAIPKKITLDKFAKMSLDEWQNYF